MANQISSVLKATHKMSDSELQSYGETELTKLERAYPKDLDAKLQSAARMVHELDMKTPGLKNLLKTKGIGDNAMVASMIIQASERYWARRK